MKIGRLSIDGSIRVATIDGDVLHLLEADSDPLTALADPSNMRLTGETVALETARLAAPLEPASIRDFMTFESHVAGFLMGRRPPEDVHPQWYEAPRFYFTNPHSVVASGAEVPVPPGCEMFDFELEVAAIVGRDGRDLTPAQAQEAIVGYTVLNDWSARDLQRSEMQVGLGPAKGKDSAITLGPWIVSSDELEGFREAGRFELQMNAYVNDIHIGGDSLAHMAWSFDELVAYASRGAWVRAGDVIGSGTCGGGCLAELWGRAGTLTPPPLAAGDLVRLDVEGIGSIENHVVSGATVVAIPPARRFPA